MRTPVSLPMLDTDNFPLVETFFFLCALAVHARKWGTLGFGTGLIDAEALIQVGDLVPYVRGSDLDIQI
jgi:hypothetical protein